MTELSKFIEDQKKLPTKVLDPSEVFKLIKESQYNKELFNNSDETIKNFIRNNLNIVHSIDKINEKLKELFIKKKKEEFLNKVQKFLQEKNLKVGVSEDDLDVSINNNNIQIKLKPYKIQEINEALLIQKEKEKYLNQLLKEIKNEKLNISISKQDIEVIKEKDGKINFRLKPYKIKEINDILLQREKEKYLHQIKNKIKEKGINVDITEQDLEISKNSDGSFRISLKNSKIEEIKRALLQKEKEDYINKILDYVRVNGISVIIDERDLEVVEEDGNFKIKLKPYKVKEIQEKILQRRRKAYINSLKNSLGIEDNLNKIFVSKHKNVENIIENIKKSFEEYKKNDPNSYYNVYKEGDKVVVEEYYYHRGRLKRHIYYYPIVDIGGYKVVLGWEDPRDLINEITEEIKITGDLNKLFDLQEVYETSREYKVERNADRISNGWRYEFYLESRDREAWHTSKYDEIREYKEISENSIQAAKSLIEANTLEDLYKKSYELRNFLINDAISRVINWGIIDYSWRDNIKMLDELRKAIENWDLNKVDQIRKELIENFMQDAKINAQRVSNEQAKLLQKRVKELLNKANNSTNFADYIHYLKKAEKVNRELANIKPDMSYSIKDIQLMANKNFNQKIEEFNKTEDLSKKMELLKEIKNLPQSKFYNFEGVESKLKLALSLPQNPNEFIQDFDKFASPKMKDLFKFEVNGDSLKGIKLEHPTRLIHITKGSKDKITNISNNSLEFFPSITPIKEIKKEDKQGSISQFYEDHVLSFYNDFSKKLHENNQKIIKTINDNKYTPGVIKNMLDFSLGASEGIVNGVVGGTLNFIADIIDTIENKKLMPRTTEFLKDLNPFKKNNYLEKGFKNVKTGDFYEFGKFAGEVGSIVVPTPIDKIVTKPLDKPIEGIKSITRNVKTIRDIKNLKHITEPEKFYNVDWDIKIKNNKVTPLTFKLDDKSLKLTQIHHLDFDIKPVLKLKEDIPLTAKLLLDKEIKDPKSLIIKEGIKNREDFKKNVQKITKKFEKVYLVKEVNVKDLGDNLKEIELKIKSFDSVLRDLGNIEQKKKIKVISKQTKDLGNIKLEKERWVSNDGEIYNIDSIITNLGTQKKHLVNIQKQKLKKLESSEFGFNNLLIKDKISKTKRILIEDNSKSLEEHFQSKLKDHDIFHKSYMGIYFEETDKLGKSINKEKSTKSFEKNLKEKIFDNGLFLQKKVPKELLLLKSQKRTTELKVSDALKIDTSHLDKIMLMDVLEQLKQKLKTKITKKQKKVVKTKLLSKNITKGNSFLHLPISEIMTNNKQKLNLKNSLETIQKTMEKLSSQLINIQKNTLKKEIRISQKENITNRQSNKVDSSSPNNKNPINLNDVFNINPLGDLNKNTKKLKKKRKDIGDKKNTKNKDYDFTKEIEKTLYTLRDPFKKTEKKKNKKRRKNNKRSKSKK